MLRLDARITYDTGEAFVKSRFILMFEDDPGKSQTFPYKWRDIEIETTESTDVAYVYHAHDHQSQICFKLTMKQATDTSALLLKKYDDEEAIALPALHRSHS